MHTQNTYVTTVYCVIAESLSSGMVDWFKTEAIAEKRYQEYINDPDFAIDTITRFNFVVNKALTPQAITDLVDEAMWEVSYTPLKRRIGTDKVFEETRELAHSGECHAEI